MSDTKRVDARLVAARIQSAIMHNDRRYAKELMLPNFLSPYWFEQDVHNVKPDGEVWEYEIKVSPRDFHDDQKKTRTIKFPRRSFTASKHEILWELYKDNESNQSPFTPPNRFWYVFPKGMLGHQEVHQFAGICEAYETYKDGAWVVRVEVVRPAPLLFAFVLGESTLPPCGTFERHYYNMMHQYARAAARTRQELDQWQNVES